MNGVTRPPQKQLTAQPCLQIPLGSACQNRCVFCIDAAHRGVKPPEPAAVRAILEHNQGLPEVLFSRLEPTLSANLPRFAGWAQELGFPEVSVITNGRRLGKGGVVERLKEAGIGTFVVSLHGHRPEIHDDLTGRPGSFDETVAGLTALCSLRERIPLRLRIVTTACARNVDHLPELHGFVRSFAPDGQGWNAVLLRGRALANADTLAVSYRRLAEALGRCVEAFPDAPPGLSNVPLCMILPVVPLAMLPLAEDVRLARIEPTGQLTDTQATADTRDHLFHPLCESCALVSSCVGLSSQYVARFGWEGVTPVRPSALQGAAEDRVGIGEARPFVPVEGLRRLFAPAGDQWRILELKASPTDAFVHLMVSGPRALHLRLVLTPRDESGPAFRRTRWFNVALQGKGCSRREEAMALAIIAWIRRREPPHIASL